jgi:hypothetical protein
VLVICHLSGSCNLCFRVNTVFSIRCHHVNRAQLVTLGAFDGIRPGRGALATLNPCPALPPIEIRFAKAWAILLV